MPRAPTNSAGTLELYDLAENRLSSISSAANVGKSAGGGSGGGGPPAREPASAVAEGLPRVFPDSLDDLGAGKTVTLKYEGKYPVGVLYDNETFLVDWHVPTKKDEQGHSVPNLEWDWNVKQRPQNTRSREAWTDPEEVS